MEIPYIVNPRKDTGLNNSKIAIWLFLASEVMLFGGLFSSYIFLRLFADYPWPERALPVLPGLINTFILIASSVTVVFAWAALKLRKWPVFVGNMAFTLVCAAIFMVFKAKEYSAKFHHHAIQYNDYTTIEGHLHADNLYKVDASFVTFNLASYHGPYLDTILDNIGASEMKLQDNYVITAVSGTSYKEELLAKEGEVVDHAQLRELLDKAKDYYIKARTHNQKVKTAALRLAWDNVRNDTSVIKGTSYAALSGVSHHDVKVKNAVNNDEFKAVMAAEKTGTLMQDANSITIWFYRTETLDKNAEDFAKKLEDLSKEKGIYSAKNLKFGDNVILSKNERIKGDKLASVVEKVLNSGFDKVDLKISNYYPISINPRWGRMSAKTIGANSTVTLKDSTNITGLAADSSMDINVDAIDFRHLVMKAREYNRSIDKDILASPVLNIKGEEGDKIRKLWAYHGEWRKLFAKHLLDEYGVDDKGNPNREPTDVDNYRITWKQMVAYMRLQNDKKEMTLDNVKSEQPGMLQGFTGADHYNDDFKPAFIRLLVPRDEIRFESDFSPRMNTYYAIYFTITGLHGLHVIGGALVLGYYLFFGYGMYKRNPEWLANRVEVAGLFWHFVDLVWIFVFPIFYLM